MSDEARLAIDRYLKGNGAGPSVAEIKLRITEFVEKRDRLAGFEPRMRWSYSIGDDYVIREGVKVLREKVRV